MNAQDQIVALNDALMIRAGIKNAGELMHPIADRYAAQENVLSGLATLCVQDVRRPAHSVDAKDMFSLGMNTSDFSNILSAAMRRVMVARLAADNEHRFLCAEHELVDFQVHDFPLIDSAPLLEEMPENTEPSSIFNITALAGLKTRILTYGKNIFVSRQLIKNDDTKLLFGFSANIGATAARLEARLVYDLIESNPLLSDAVVMFHADKGNLGTVAPLSLASISEGIAALRNMLTPSGEKANLKAASIVVAPEHELSVKTILKAAASESIRVIPSPWITSTNWYLAADPELAPVINLLYLKNVKHGMTLSKARKKGTPPIDLDGILLGARFDVGAVPVGRVGIFKGRTA